MKQLRINTFSICSFIVHSIIQFIFSLGALGQGNKYINSIKFFSLTALWLASSPCYASNVSITSVSLTNQNTTAKTYDVFFNITWENSWKNSVNNDAIWIFIKYKVNNGSWSHAQLSNGICNYSTGNQGNDATIQLSNLATGVMFSRNTIGSGTFSSTNVKLIWDYGLNGVNDNDVVNIQVIPLEMVYIPTASFYIGDGTSNGRFHAGGNPSQPFLVNGLPITFGNTTGNLWADNTQTPLPGGALGPFPWDSPTNTLQANYPTGYYGFYSMKYETSMGDYALFLNSLTNTQAINHFPIATEMASNGAACNPCRYNITFSGTTYTTTTPSRANNWATWRDATAYLDWAGLRPMTELEMEKINRGTANAIAAEFAWGTSSIFQVNSVQGVDGSGSETANPQTSNAHYGLNGVGTIQGPIKIGIFENHSTREAKGESFYGVMDMSGGVVEMIVSLGNTNGRNYIGNNGDGIVDANGYANTTGWILNSTDATQIPNGGWGFKGGDFWNSDLDLRTSIRNVATFAGARRLFGLGFRGAMTNNFLPICSSVSLIENTQTEHQIIYPNPTSGKVFLENYFYLIEKKVYDITGKVLLKTFDNAIDFTNYPNGIYYITTQDVNNKIVNFKIIKQ